MDEILRCDAFSMVGKLGPLQVGLRRHDTLSCLLVNSGTYKPNTAFCNSLLAVTKITAGCDR